MIAGLVSPPVEAPRQESDNDSLPGQGYTSSHASSDEQPAILLLDDSTSSSHATSSTTEGRQAIPVTPDRPTAIPRLKILANIALWLVVAPCERLRCACATHGRSSRCVFIQRYGVRGRNDNDSGARNFAELVHCLKRLHRAQYELGRWPIQTAGVNAYPTTTLQTALLIRQIGGPRASRLLLCVVPAELR